MAGYLIALEGIDGSGKSTVVDALWRQLRQLRTAVDVVTTYEPGDTVLGDAIRAVIRNYGSPIEPRVMTLLMVADRLHHYQTVIQPVLADGGVVITDRYMGSTIAYQGYAEPSMSIPWIRSLHDDLGLPPANLTVLLDLPADVAVQRAGEALLTVDQGDLEYMQLVRSGYLWQAETDGWPVVDATQPLDKVIDDVLQIILQQI